MRPNVGAFLAPAAQLNEMAAQGLSQAAKFWEQIGQAALERFRFGLSRLGGVHAALGD